MSDTAPTIPSRIPPKQIDRMAWAIVWLAFAMFCGVCIGTTVAVYAFLFYSVAPLTVEAQVGKGTVVISSSDLGERGQREYEALPVRPARLSTDTLSQATLVINTSDASDGQFVAAVTLKNNSEVLLRRANRPRFDWSNGQYEIELTELSGDIDIVVGDIGVQSIKIQIFTSRGEKITLTRPGRYAISVSDLRVEVSNRRGEAVLSSADQKYNLLLPAGQDGLLLVGREPVTGLSRINLIDHGLFIFDVLDVTEDGTIRMPPHWGCANSTAQQQPPSGQYIVTDWAGRTALQMVRGDNATTNGETRCQQPYSAPERDVSGYTLLELETTFLIKYQSISECGIEGSECPLMIHLVYTDINGAPREWYQGFYASLDPLYDYKSRCASCTQDHQQINEQVWYTYESGNLFNVLPEEARPATINKIEFYASGHQYDVYVGEISLFAGDQDALPPDGTAPLGPNS